MHLTWTHSTPWNWQCHEKEIWDEVLLRGWYDNVLWNTCLGWLTQNLHRDRLSQTDVYKIWWCYEGYSYRECWGMNWHLKKTICIWYAIQSWSVMKVTCSQLSYEFFLCSLHFIHHTCYNHRILCESWSTSCILQLFKLLRDRRTFFVTAWRPTPDPSLFTSLLTYSFFSRGHNS